MLLFLLLIIIISSTTSNEIDSDQPFLPKFDQSYETVSVVVGKRALLPCYVSLQDAKNNGLGSFKVIWMKLNNSSILTMEDRAINGDSRISLLHAYVEEWNLQIDDIDEDDAGFYRCFTNSGIQKTLILDVKVPPKIIDELTTKPYPNPIRTGSNFTIKCYAHGKPIPKIRILSYDQFDNVQIISEQNQVTIVNISRHTNSRYECIASNGYPPDVARSFQLTIQYAPDINLFVNQNITLDRDIFIDSNSNEIRLKCQAIMNPIGKVYWMKDNKRFNYDHHINYSENYIVSELIVLTYFTNNYGGEYTCVASNVLGSISKTIQLIDLTTKTITTTTTMPPSTIKRNTTRHQHTKSTQPAITVYHSTESLRMMTLSSNSVNHHNSYYVTILLLTIIHSGLFRIR